MSSKFNPNCKQNVKEVRCTNLRHGRADTIMATCMFKGT